MPDDPGSDTSNEKAPGAKPRASADTVVQHGFPQLAHNPDAPVLPGYDLLEEVGRGGMGIVYRARDRALGRDVAVKILHDRYPADGPAARQFLEEAQITGQLVHPGIPPIHLVGVQSDGRPFLVMKLIKGQTLDRLLGETNDRARLLAIFEKMCEAVAYAHARGVIHRDLKPSNVMVGAFGEMQVMDWGLAKVLRDNEQPESEPAGATTDHSELRVLHADDTRAGSVMGTPAYMPPEQAGGELAKIDRRADVFALGGILCAILTGRAPYSGATPDEVHLKAVRGQTAEALTALTASGAESELVALCARCLSTDPAARPKAADEVAQAVAAVRRAGEERARQSELDRVRIETEREVIRRSQMQPVVAPTAPAPTTPPPARPSRRAVLVGGTALAAALGGYFTFRKRAEEKPPDDGGGLPRDGTQQPSPLLPNPPAVLVPRREVVGDVAGIAISDDGRWLAVALGDWDPAVKVGGVKLFDRSRGTAPEVWWKWRDAPCRGAAFSPDGKLLAVAVGGALRVINLSDETEVAFPDAVFDGDARAVAFAPTGKYLAVGFDRTPAEDRTPRPGFARVWDVATRAKPTDFERGNLPVRCVAFTPDGATLATGMTVRSADLASGVDLWTVATGAHVRRITAGGAVNGPHVAFARTSSRCAISDSDSVRFYNPPDADPLEREFRTDGAGEPGAVALRSDGAVVAFALGVLIHLGDMKTGTVFATFEKHEQSVSALAFTLDGKTLISGGHDRTVREWTVPDTK